MQAILSDDFKVMPRATRKKQNLWLCHGKEGDGRFSCSFKSTKEVATCPKCGGKVKLA